MVDKLLNKFQSPNNVVLKGREVNISDKLHGVEAELRFIEAVRKGDVSVVRKFMRFGFSPEIIRDEYNRPLIFLACRVGAGNIVSEFLDNNVDINATTFDGQTALHVAVSKKHVNVVKLLLVSGASWTAKTLSGMKPIDIADYNSEIWHILKSAEDGMLPEMISYKIPELESKVEEQQKPPEPKKRKKKKKEKITEEVVEEKTVQTLNRREEKLMNSEG